MVHFLLIIHHNPARRLTSNSSRQPEGPRCLSYHNRGVPTRANYGYRRLESAGGQLGHARRQFHGRADQRIYQGLTCWISGAELEERRLEEAGGLNQVCRQEGRGCGLRPIATESHPGAGAAVKI